MTQEKTVQKNVDRVVQKLAYRTSHAFSRRPGTVYTKYEDEFQYDEKNNCLKVVGSVDTQEIIESNMDCTLKRILDKYLPEEVDKAINKNVVFVDGVHERVNQDLSDLGAEYERVNDIRDRYGFDDSLSYFEILDQLKTKQLELADTIKRLENKNIQEVANETQKNE